MLLINVKLVIVPGLVLVGEIHGLFRMLPLEIKRLITVSEGVCVLV